MGELIALFVAACWAISSYIFSRAMLSMSPLRLNLVKGLIASALLLLVVILQNQPWPQWQSAWGWLLLSGAIGIAVGDTLYFAALRRLGARRSLLLETLAPAMTALLALAWLGSSIGLSGWLGMVLIMLGLWQVFGEQKVDAHADVQLKGERQFRLGIICGAGAALCQSMGMVLAFDALQQAQFSAGAAALLRMLAGLTLVAIFMGLQQRNVTTKPKLSSRNAALLFFGVFIGTFLAIWLQQLSLQHTRPELAQALFATAPLFGLIIARLRGEHLSQRAIVGAMIAVAGVAVLLML